jgi:hypothetical protein
MNISTAIDVIESCPGFTESDTPAGEAWAVVLSCLYPVLSQPEPEGLEPGYIDAEHTGRDREMLEVFYKACQLEGGTADEIHLRGLEAVLQRFARPTTEPVPVAERLPGPEDLDHEGTCWMFHPANFHYCLCRPDPSVHTHWLPHHALPVPGAEVR